MGLAADATRLAVGTGQEIRQYRNMTPVCRRLEPPGRHDACFLDRAVHVTGDIDIHEMAWAGDELWFVNTRFSCLCTLNGIHSFVPRWRPPFVTGLAPQDRCHLNGLGLAPGSDGQLVPRYVTALAATDTPGGWREHKKDGGVLLDVPGGNVLAGGLSMPHSPRWVHDRLWLLESGTGGLGFVDLAAGRYRNIIELPGFTRGLDIFGNLAFVGLSQVRESAGLQRHPHRRTGAGGTQLRRLGRGPAHGPDGGVPAFRGRGAGGVRGAGAAWPALPGAGPRRPQADGRLLRFALRGTGASAGAPPPGGPGNDKSDGGGALGRRYDVRPTVCPKAESEILSMFHFRSWLRRVTGRLFIDSFRPRRTARRRSMVPRFEYLEVRVVPSTITVTDKNDSGVGSLRQAILDASSGDTIAFASGVTGKITLTSGELSIAKNLTISGPGASILTVSGDSTSRVFDIRSCYGRHIRPDHHGRQRCVRHRHPNDHYGGGIYNTGTLTLTDSTVSGSSAQYGGGIFDNIGTLTLIDSTITQNHAADGGGNGGGISIDNGGVVNLTGSQITQNSAGYGGGIDCSVGTTVTLTDSTVSGNAASAAIGGGIRNQGSLYLYSSTISGNQAATNGGDIDNQGNLTAIDSTIAFGTAASVSGFGGGITNSGTMTLTDSIVAGNSAFSGGGIYNSNFGMVTLNDSTVANNTDANFTARIPSGGGIDNKGTLYLVDNSIVSGNYSAAKGGGIYNSGVVSLTDSTVSGNQAQDGGGIYSVGTLTIADSTLSGNQAVGAAGQVGSSTGAGGGGGGGAGLGGAIFSIGTVTLVNSTLSGNQAVGGAGGRGYPNHGSFFGSGGNGGEQTGGSGGRSYYAGGSRSGNPGQAGGFGGGGGGGAGGTGTGHDGYGYGGAGGFGGGGGGGGGLTPGGSGGKGGVSAFGGGKGGLAIASGAAGGGGGAGLGGAIFVNSGTLKMLDSTIDGNTALGGAGGIGAFSGPNTDPSKGTAGSGIGGGVFNNSGTVTLSNSIIAADVGNSSQDVYGSFSSSGHNLVGVIDSTSSGWVSSDLTGTPSSPLNARLAPLGSYGGPTQTMTPLPGSLAIGQGDPNPGEHARSARVRPRQQRRYRRLPDAAVAPGGQHHGRHRHGLGTFRRVVTARRHQPGRRPEWRHDHLRDPHIGFWLRLRHGFVHDLAAFRAL